MFIAALRLYFITIRVFNVSNIFCYIIDLSTIPAVETIPFYNHNTLVPTAQKHLDLF